ncbi:hypothetical protein ATY77_16770 [Rhizobium sp. R634]|uniref:hypothetical protein n=1 Tax=Rhizobium sp. R634 TaxID=1764274 RepID=UPI000B535349|nr:hypothetical protein [Rhizobium sp. R634]OWV70419.1 hypothetical protein ATY77_16770 [Rhizobium sp. R634]
MKRSVRDLRFDALRNGLYHTARRMTFERRNRICNFLVIILGAAAMGDAFKPYGFDIQKGWFGASVAIIGAAQLVFDFGGRARDHQSLQKEYYHLLADIEACLSPTDEQVAVWNGRMTRILSDEPPTYRVIDAKAYNDALDSLGNYDRSNRLIIPYSHRLLGSLFTFDGAPYDTIAESGEKKKSVLNSSG